MLGMAWSGMGDGEGLLMGTGFLFRVMKIL